MVGMGFTRDEIRDSLSNQKYNEVTATYLLLGRKNEVSTSALLFVFPASTVSLANFIGIFWDCISFAS